MKRIIISALALIIIAAAAVSGYLWWTKHKAATPTETETEIALADKALGEIPETTESGDAIQPVLPTSETAATAESGGAIQPAMSTGETVAPAEAPAGEITGPIDLSTDQTGPEIPVLGPETTSRSVAIPATTETQRETRPVTTSTTESVPVITETTETTGETVTTTEVVETSTQGLVEATPTPTATPDSTKPDATPTPLPGITPTPTPTSTTPSTTPTPGPVPTTPGATPTPGPAPGRFSVVTRTPVLEPQLQIVRNAMRRIGVQLQEQRTGQQRLRAYRVSLGYFRTKAEATSWARTNLRPKNIEYLVYPAQGMHSIQLGVFTQQRSVDQKMQELYQRFPGWRLPLRTEMTSIPTFHYQLSIRGITENLARKIQDTLFRMRIQSELTGR
ncbi:hypothetical protein U27_05870 [Candidatus Vecturithrix granuli]|uniref:SPOR domain-containing protein n=1 Tax=Vecturithrix granuli TaxID=1499967 RepID=A0A081C2U0_VECG1|nr:hypothetical protein U27_05870 [Candidatus Vecturithrix granuli]